MTEENEPDPPPKVIEPPQRSPKVAKQKEIAKEPVKSISTDEKLKEAVPPQIDKHLHDKILMFGQLVSFLPSFIPSSRYTYCRHRCYFCPVYLPQLLRNTLGRKNPL